MRFNSIYVRLTILIVSLFVVLFLRARLKEKFRASEEGVEVTAPRTE